MFLINSILVMSFTSTSSRNPTCATCAQTVVNGTIINGRIYCDQLCSVFSQPDSPTSLETNGPMTHPIPLRKPTRSPPLPPVFFHTPVSPPAYTPVYPAPRVPTPPASPRTHPLDLTPWDGENCSVCAQKIGDFAYESKGGMTCSLNCRDQGTKNYNRRCETEPVFDCVCVYCKTVFKSNNTHHYPSKVGYFCSFRCVEIRSVDIMAEAERKLEASKPKQPNCGYQTSDSFTYVVMPTVVHKPIKPPNITFIPLPMIQQTGALPAGFFTTRRY